MMHALITAMWTFTDGVLGLHFAWKLWLGLMIVVNGILPFWFLPHPAAIVVLVAATSGFAVGLIICLDSGFSKLLALMHGPWVPMVAYQGYILGRGVDPSNFKTWLMSSFIISIISLIIDTADLVAYFRSKN